jgi:hypothetical protein
MQTFVADSRSGSMSSASACDVCCCQPASVRPGETNLWYFQYSDWVSPIGGRGLVGAPVFDIQNITPQVPVSSGNAPPKNIDYIFNTPYGTPYAGTVSTSATDPNGDTLTYAVVPLYAGQGTVVMAPNGSFTYTPPAGFSGYDSFYYTTSDQVNLPVMNQVQLRIDPQAPAFPLPNPPASKLLSVPMAQVQVMNPVVRVPIVASPALRAGDIYRMTVRQAAMDCTGVSYFHVLCLDVSVGSC